LAMTVELADDEIAKQRATPVGKRDEVLRGSERLQPALEISQELLDVRRIMAGLAGNALDDGQQVARAMADFAQQGTQALLAMLALGCLDLGGDHAADRAVIGIIGIDP